MLKQVTTEDSLYFSKPWIKENSKHQALQLTY